MAFLNQDALDRGITEVAEAVTITHFTGSQTYDADQEPTKSSTDTAANSKIKDPSKFDVERLLGKITINDKKFIFPSATTIDINDNITVTRTGDIFSVKAVDDKVANGRIIKTIAFASKVE